MKKKLEAYQKIAKRAAKLWVKCGALEVRECAGDDLDVKMGMPLPKGVRLKPGETVCFSWIIYKSRAHRDRVNAKVMKGMSAADLDSEAMPFDVTRMLYGGFKTIVVK